MTGLQFGGEFSAVFTSKSLWAFDIIYTSLYIVCKLLNDVEMQEKTEIKHERVLRFYYCVSPCFSK